MRGKKLLKFNIDAYVIIHKRNEWLMKYIIAKVFIYYY